MVETRDPLFDAPFTKFSDPLITCTLHMSLDDEVVDLVLSNDYYVSQCHHNEPHMLKTMFRYLY